MFSIFKTASILFGVLTLITGVAYPLAVTAFAQVAFPREANGSLFEARHDKAPRNLRAWRGDPSKVESWIGSDWIGQPFRDEKYFWGRPSSTAPFACNAMAGSGSNLSTTNPALQEAVRERVAKLRQADPDNQAKVPVDLVTASASGLDPHISEAAALYQVERIARVRKIEPYTVNKLVLSHTERPTLGIFGQTRVNVLKLNLALDEISAAKAEHSREPADKK